MGLKWSVEYNTGIDVIDDQHRRILDYINEIADLKHSHDRVKMKEVLDNIMYIALKAKQKSILGESNESL